MKIAIFTDSFLPGIGGTENVVLRLSKELSKNHEVIVFAPDYHRPYEENLELPFKVVRAKSIGFTKNDYWAMPGATKLIKKTLDEFKPDVLHTHTLGMMAGYANKYGKKHNIPVICTVHTKFKYCYKHVFKLNILINILLAHVIKRAEKADRVCSVSYSMIPELKSYGLKNKEVTVIKNGNDSKAEHEIVKTKNDKFVILYVGMIIGYKNLGFSLSALAELKKRRSDFVFYMVGRGSHEKKFKKMSEKLGLKDNVIMTGAITDRNKLNEIYAMSDLFLFTSIFDNDGLVILEAADMGTPALVIENTGASERFIPEQTGFVAKYDAVSVADKIEELMGEREKLVEVGKRARSIFIPWEKVAEDYLNIYKEEIALKTK